MNLIGLGWNSTLEQSFLTFASHGFVCGRVSIVHKSAYKVFTANGECTAELSGKLRFQSASKADLPAAGDWVVLQERAEGEGMLIHAVLPRKSKFSRKAAGPATEEQVAAANADTVFLVNALNQDFNLRRIERYLIMAWESGANPVIILSKADLCENVPDKVSQVEAIAPGVPIHVISSLHREGVAALSPYLTTGQTVALLGSSGAGKSTLINCLAGEDIQRVNDIRQGDDRGKHTTTHRELIPLPGGGLIMDTPGMRELQLWETSEGLSSTFDDIEEMAKSCRFNDCKHRNEPGCAVQLALLQGTLDGRRYRNYLKLQKELAYLQQKVTKAQVKKRR